MNVYNGVLKKKDIGAGGWQLVCKDGSVYDLYGNIPQELQNQTVNVKASATGGTGFLMGGPALSVTKIEKAN
ncbi:MAG: hypothetical protein VX278_06360 [Myxococcota bacterium]|nr:hypothetical protein [Myxococcota bacterium]